MTDKVADHEERAQIVAENKHLERRALRQFEKLAAYKPVGAGFADQPWYAEARKHIEDGFALLNRAILPD